MTDEELIEQIINRYESIVIDCGHDFNKSDKHLFIMIIDACHTDGIALDLEGLLAASDFDLIHDITGIMRHYDPAKEKMFPPFLPRYAKKGE